MHAEAQRGLIEYRRQWTARKLELQTAERRADVKALCIVPMPAPFRADAGVEHASELQIRDHERRQRRIADTGEQFLWRQRALNMRLRAVAQPGDAVVQVEIEIAGTHVGTDVELAAIAQRGARRAQGRERESEAGIATERDGGGIERREHD